MLPDERFSRGRNARIGVNSGHAFFGFRVGLSWARVCFGRRLRS